MPGAVWFPGPHRSTTPSRRSGTRSDERPGAGRRRGGRRAGRDLLGDAARPGRRLRRDAAPARRPARRPGRRATCPTCPRRWSPSSARPSIGAVWSSCAPDFGTRGRARPVRPDRAHGAGRRRRLPVQRQGLRPAGRRRRAAGRAADRADDDRRPPALPRRAARRRAGLGRGGRRRAGAGRSSRCRSTTRCGSSTRRAPPGCRRGSCTGTAASSSSSCKQLGPAPGRRRRRPLLLVRVDRLDHVEHRHVARCWPARRSSSTTAPRPTRRSTRSSPSSPGPALTVPRHQPRLPAAPARRPASGPGEEHDLSALRALGVHRLAAAGRRRSAGSTTPSAPTCMLGSLSGGHRRRHRLHRQLPAAAGDGGRAPAADARRRARRPGTRTGSRCVGELGELVVTEPMPSMPLHFWNDPDGTPLPRGLLRAVARGLAARRLAGDHRARHLHRSPAGRTPRSTAAASGWARADIYAAVESIPAVARLRRPRRRAARRRLLDAAVRAARAGGGARPTSSGAAQDGDPGAGVAAARARRDHRRPRGAAHPHRQAAGGAAQAAVPGRRPGARRSTPARWTTPRWSTTTSPWPRTAAFSALTVVGEGGVGVTGRA